MALNASRDRSDDWDFARDRSQPCLGDLIAALYPKSNRPSTAADVPTALERPNALPDARLDEPHHPLPQQAAA